MILYEIKTKLIKCSTVNMQFFLYGESRNHGSPNCPKFAVVLNSLTDVLLLKNKLKPFPILKFSKLEEKKFVKKILNSLRRNENEL